MSKSRAETVKELLYAVDTQTVSTIDCWVCGESYSEEDDAPSFAKKLYKKGWRIMESAEYKTKGPVCRECIANV